MRAATSCPSCVRTDVAARSSPPIVISEFEPGKIRHKCRFVLKAAQIEYQRAVLDPTDHRNGQAAKRGSEPFERAAGMARGARPDRQAGARYALERQRARTDLAGTGDILDREA